MASSILPEDKLTDEQRRLRQVLRDSMKAAEEYGLERDVLETAIIYMIQGEPIDSALRGSVMDWDL